MNPGTIVQSEWGSHLPAVLACFASTAGPVLELGVGHCSTPVLHALCLASGRLLVSVEENEEWFWLFHGRYQTTGHDFFKGLYSELVPKLANEYAWSVSLIDNSPGGERRLADFRSLIGCSGFVVVHDYWKDNQEAIESSLGSLDYYVCKAYEPPTLVASATRKIPESIIEK